MIHRNKIVGALAGALVCLAAAPSLADSSHGSVRLGADLDGYQEVPMTLNSPGSGEIVARIRQNGTAIEYKLTYRDLPNVTQAHIHFGRPALNGGVLLWMCFQTPVPAPRGRASPRSKTSSTRFVRVPSTPTSTRRRFPVARSAATYKAGDTATMTTERLLA